MSSPGISDVDLRAQLRAYGENVGPITDTTRSVYLKKLGKLKSARKSSPSRVETSGKSPVQPATESAARLFDVGSTSSSNSPKTSPRQPELVNRPTYVAPKISTPESPLRLDSRQPDLGNRPEFTVPKTPPRLDYGNFASRPSIGSYTTGRLRMDENNENYSRVNSKPQDQRRSLTYNMAPPARNISSTNVSATTTLGDKLERLRDDAYRSLEKTAEKFGLRDKSKKEIAPFTPDPVASTAPKYAINGRTETLTPSTTDWLRSRRQDLGNWNYAPPGSFTNRKRWWHLDASTSRTLLILFCVFLALLAVLYEVILNKNKVRIFVGVLIGATVDTASFIYNHLILPSLLVLLVIGIILGVFWYKKYKWHKTAEEQQQIFDMVEKILALLKKHYEESLLDPTRQQCLAVPHVRDMLIPPSKRKELTPIWDKAVQYLNENESRLRTENQIISGEEFMVWRWLQSGNPGTDEKIWQGHAFPEEQASLNMPALPFSECLKLRGLFDPDLEDDEENWPEHIQDAVLEKLGASVPVMHVAVDMESKEGCAYLKLRSKEDAANAFKILHGSWFNGRLVTVKYLRTERYHERFPEATRCPFPLRVKKPRHSLLG